MPLNNKTTKGVIVMNYYCYNCDEWFEYDDQYAIERSCPNCGRNLEDEDLYAEGEAQSEMRTMFPDGPDDGLSLDSMPWDN